MNKSYIKYIKNIIYILYLIHFFDYCKLYDISLYLILVKYGDTRLSESDSVKFCNVIDDLNNFMISLLNRYSNIRKSWFIAVYRAIIYIK